MGPAQVQGVQFQRCKDPGHGPSKSLKSKQGDWSGRYGPGLNGSRSVIKHLIGSHQLSLLSELGAGEGRFRVNRRWTNFPSSQSGVSLLCQCCGVSEWSLGLHPRLKVPAPCPHRYTAVAMPMLYNTRYSSKRRVTVMISIVWVLSFTISCPLLFGLNNTGESCLWLPGAQLAPALALCRTLRELNPGADMGGDPSGACSPPRTEARLSLLGQARLRVVPGKVREEQWPGAQGNWVRSGDNASGGCLAIFNFV